MDSNDGGQEALASIAGLRVRGVLRWEKRQSRPTRTDGGDPLVKAVWETGVEVRLERHGASPHVPRSEASQCSDGVWSPAKFPTMEKHND